MLDIAELWSLNDALKRLPQENEQRVGGSLIPRWAVARHFYKDGIVGLWTLKSPSRYVKKGRARFMFLFEESSIDHTFPDSTPGLIPRIHLQ